MDQGWLSLLSTAYVRKADVFNRGFSGYNTNHAVIMLDKQIHRWFQPATAHRVVSVCFGANDSVHVGLPSPLSVQHVPLDQFETNLIHLIQRIQQYQPHGGESSSSSLQSTHNSESFGSFADGSTSVLLITPPPIDEVAWLRTMAGRYGPTCTTLNRTNKHTGLYANAVCEVARQYSLPCVDLYHTMLAKKGWQSMLSDGLHLTESGNKLLFELVLDCLQTNFPELSPSALPFEGPVWSSIDATDPARSFVSRSATTDKQGVSDIHELS